MSDQSDKFDLTRFETVEQKVRRYNREHPELPLLPYAGTSGWNGSNASLARALADDSSGVTTIRQTVALQHVKNQEFRGLTWKDLGEMENLHAGQASGVLSVLHKEGLIVRLEERRDRCSIYVVPDFVREREVSPRKNYGMTKTQLSREIVSIIDGSGSDEIKIDKIMLLIMREGY